MQQHPFLSVYRHLLLQPHHRRFHLQVPLWSSQWRGLTQLTISSLSSNHAWILLKSVTSQSFRSMCFTQLCHLCHCSMNVCTQLCSHRLVLCGRSMFHSAVSPLSLLHECLLTAVHGVNPHQAYRLRQTSSMTETSSALQRSHQNLPNHQICPQSRQVPVTSVYCMVAI